MCVTGGYNDHPPAQYDDRFSNDGRGTPQRGMYDEDIRRSEAALVNAPPRDHFSDGRQTPSVHGEGKRKSFFSFHFSFSYCVISNYLDQVTIPRSVLDLGY